MLRFVSVLVSVIILVAAFFAPGGNMAIDAVNYNLTAANAGQAEHQSVQTAQYVMAAATPKPTPTPVPTPSPTPSPTPTPPPVMMGTENSEVASIQTQLMTLGFMYAVVDGIYGKDTEKAVKELKQYLNEIDAKQNPVNHPPIDYSPYFDANGKRLTGEDKKPVPTPTPNPTKEPIYPPDGTSISHELIAILNDVDNFPMLSEAIKNGDQGINASRLQRRLDEMGYIFKGVDGAFGRKTEDALKEFQRVNGLSESGVADERTQRVLFSTRAKENDKNLHLYKLEVDISDQKVYVYQWSDSTKSYSIKYKQMICSTGNKDGPTPLGSYQDSTGPGARWHYFSEFRCWAQYAFYIQGNILFHSVLFTKDDEKTLIESSVSNLGRRASHGCVRLAVKDAKWIYENCTFGTPVVVKE